jgi:putative NADPH-quinone reductase
MNILIVVANPEMGSFCNAIAETAAETARKLGYNVILHDLYREKFPPILDNVNEGINSNIPFIIKKHCMEIGEADGIIIVHPNWWGMPPAVMKGWIDRVIKLGVAYKFKDNDKGDGVPVGLLKASKAIVFNTSNTKPDREKKVFKDPLDTIWKNCVFGICGIKKVTRVNYGVIVTSSATQRKTWLKNVADTIKKEFKEAVKVPKPNQEPA